MVLLHPKLTNQSVLIAWTVSKTIAACTRASVFMAILPPRIGNTMIYFCVGGAGGATIAELCNGVDDCGDGSDEVNFICESKLCLRCL